MSRTHIVVLLFSAVFLSCVCAVFGIDKVANYIQVASAIPWAWVLYRVEQRHRREKRKEHDKR